MMKIFIYDVHASESGALAILDDLYLHIKQYPNKSIEWIFIVSTPFYRDTENIKVVRNPWVKKSWFHRFFFDTITTRLLLKKFNPDKVFSLQNKGISFYRKPQMVYLHLPFILCEYKFNIQQDGLKLWAYQNILRKRFYPSLRKVQKIIVQTTWMKEKLIEKALVKKDNIEVLKPDISVRNVYSFEDSKKNRSRFFYPATAFSYKNHQIILDAFKIMQQDGFNNYEVIFTLDRNQNNYTNNLAMFVEENSLNVKFRGAMKRSEVFEIYSKSVLIFPSFIESFGMPLLEARMSNAIVLASDCNFSREVLHGYNNKIFFDPWDVNELISCLKKVNDIKISEHISPYSNQTLGLNLIEKCISL